MEKEEGREKKKIGERETSIQLPSNQELNPKSDQKSNLDPSVKGTMLQPSHTSQGEFLNLTIIALNSTIEVLPVNITNLVHDKEIGKAQLEWLI